MKASKKLSALEIADLESLNVVLKEKTGIDFLDKMLNFAKNEKATEVEVKEFLRTKCPMCGQPTQSDKINLSLLSRFYLEKDNDFDLIRQGSSVTFGQVKIPTNPWDAGFRSRRDFGNFSTNENHLAFATGFFPKE